MSKKLVRLFHGFIPAIILLTLLLVMAPMGAVRHAVAAGDWYVDPGESIQTAIDAADAAGGGTVHVAAGTYYELITLSNGVLVQGAGATVTTINADTSSDGIGDGSVVSALNVNSTAGLDGFTITNGTDSGGMLNSSSSPTVTNCTFSGNLFSGMFNKVSSDPTVTNCTFSGNLGHGMVNDEMCDPTVTNCTFSGNEASEGGGMFNGDSSRPTVTNCTFSGNEANGGGGMYNENSSPRLTNCTFSGNGGSFQTSYAGGGMSNNNSSPILTDCTFSGNESGDGGGMYNNGSSPTLFNCTFSGNHASSGGGMYNYSNSSPSLTNCTLSGNWAESAAGGGMYNDSSSPTLFNCTFSENDAYDIGAGGGMYNNNSSPTLVDCTFSENEASGELGYMGSGGGMCNDNSSPSLTNCTFSSNWAGSMGGGYGGGMSNHNSSPTLVNCTFSGNYIAGDLGYVGYGGGMSNDNSSPMLTNCTFSSNCNTSGVFGAGMYNNDSSPTLTYCTFSGNGNSSFVVGGGMCNNNSSPTLTDCTFSGNDSRTGGGMSNDNSSPTLTNCAFSGNFADSTEGGGMYNNSSSPTLTDCTFVANGTSERGGGICNVNNSSPSLTNCTFFKNYGIEVGAGGGMANRDSSPSLTNCTFSGNWVTDFGNGGVGGGMYNSDSSPTLTNCTFTGNSVETGDPEGTDGYGGGMYNHNSSPTLTNCILWGDYAEEIHSSGAASPVVAYCDVMGGYSGTGNVNLDPHFVDAAGPDGVAGTEDDDLHLSVGSPCIDAGSNSAPSLPNTDFEGDDRILDGDNDGTATVDMGADEAVGPNRTPPAPTNISPSNGDTDVSLTATLESSAFSDPDAGDNHAASQWQVRTALGDYSSPVFDSNADAEHLTSIDVSSLTYSTIYFWHVRYQDNHGGWSDWSAETSFTTINRPPNQPSNNAPVNGASGIGLAPTLQSSIFSDPDAGNTHAASQWQIRGASGDYASSVFDSQTDTTNLLTIAVPSGKLAYSTTYYWHVRHQDNHGGWSAWSAETSFNTASQPQADFSVISVRVSEGVMLVFFSNLSSGGASPLTYAWDFDNNGTIDATEREPWHHYDASGTYTVSLTVTDGWGETDTETKTNCLTILAPIGGKTETADGRIGAEFPAGAVDGTSVVTIGSTAASPLPERPKGFQIGKTNFVIMALDQNGDPIVTLHQPSTITVKYSEADLAAGGNPKRLVLAYYDDAAGEWKPLKTKVNTEDMTLSAPTTHLSTWAVLAKTTSASNGLHSWSWVVIGLAAVLLMGTGTYLVARRVVRH